MNTNNLYDVLIHELHEGEINLNEAERLFALELIDLKASPDSCNECMLGYFRVCGLNLAILSLDSPTCEPHHFVEFILESI